MVEVVLDPGHGGYDVGATGINGIKEKECTLFICKACEVILKKRKIDVKLTRRDDMYLSERERNKIAKSLDGKVFISVHLNSSNNLMDCGTEIFYNKNSVEGFKISRYILESINRETGISIIGIKEDIYKELSGLDNAAALIKICFLSNLKEENLLKDYNFKEKVAKGLADGILKYLDQENEIISEKSIIDNVIMGDDSMTNIKTNIIDKPWGGKENAKQWAKNRGATETFIGLADLYWKFSSECGGVNPTLAYAQAALETGYGKFGGAVKEEFKNPCGLKTAIANDDSPDAHAKFKTWEDGVLAHLDHLALYAGAVGYPKAKSPDPKHYQYLFGVCKYVEDLGGIWAAGDEYGFKVIKLMESIKETVAIDDFEEEYVEKGNLEDVPIIDIEDKVINLNEILSKLRDEYIDIFKEIEESNKSIEKYKEENSILKEEIKNLRERVIDYKKIIERIYSLVDIK